MWNIALNTLKEIIRNKFLYLILVFAVLFLLLSIGLGKLTIGEGEKVILDFGLALIEIFGLIGVLFVGSQLLFKEIEGKTIFLILSKPIQRYEFILGKFIGFAGVITIITFLQALLFIVVLFVKDINVDHLILLAIGFIYLKLLILISLVLFFSIFISPILTIIISLFVYFISHTYSLLVNLFESLQIQIGIYFTKLFQLLFPPFEALNFKDSIGSFVVYEPIYFLLNGVYGVLYLVIILLFTCLIFNKKRFEN